MRTLLVAALLSAIAAAQQGKITLLDIPSDYPGFMRPGYIEIHGVGAGPFNPSLWRSGLNWVADVRSPLLAPRQGGGFRNIFAPMVVEEPYGWRLFYGGWDGVQTANDRLYSRTTADFADFDNYATVIEPGAFVHAGRGSVQKHPDGTYHLIATATLPDGQKLNRPIYVFSPDGNNWNGTPQPHAAQTAELLDIPNFEGWATADLSGLNVLLRDRNRWVLYFGNSRNPQQIYRAEAASDPTRFTFTGTVLATQATLSDVRKLRETGFGNYLMGLYRTTSTLWYSLSDDGLTYQEPAPFLTTQSPDERYIGSLSFVTKGNSVLGVIYGAGATPALDRNRLYARWLQKRLVFATSDGVRLEPEGAIGPDRIRFKVPTDKNLAVTLTVLAEDGVRVLGAIPLVWLSSRHVYKIVVQ